MRFSADTLIAIAKKMVELEKIDIVVSSFRLQGYTILVETTDTQMDGRSYYMVGAELTQGRPIKDNPQA